ncbi:MAG: STAS domain-containing protein [Spirochaetia bacterium]|jgi:anti-anti-sigma regulatory factor|nr:STAS domain-containing protein [Spirochaetia bacterium]
MDELTITLPGSAGIASISDLHQELLGALGTAASGSSILLDASTTSAADSSLAQLLLSFKTEASAHGIHVSVLGLKEALSLKNLLCCDAAVSLDADVGPSEVGSP